MSKSQSLRVTDVLRVHRLYGELSGLPPLSAQWKRCLLEGALRLIPARLALMPEALNTCEGGAPKPRSSMAAGWLDETGRRLLQEYHMRPDAASMSPLLPALSRQSRRFFTLLRQELVSDQAWLRSELVIDYLRPGGVKNNVVSVYRIDRRGWMIALDLYRAWGDKPFSQRDRNVLHVLNAGLIPIYRDHLEPPGQDHRPLSPRAQETLEYLLAGDSEKQIARRMDLSRHTVHQYVKALHHQFGVSSRSELLVACLAPDRRQSAYEHRIDHGTAIGSGRRNQGHRQPGRPLVFPIRLDGHGLSRTAV